MLASTFLLLFSVSIGNAFAGNVSAADQKIIDAGVTKAAELGLNPVPMCEKDDGNKFIPAGFTFNIDNGEFALKDGDMLINVTRGSITAAGVVLNRGEYAVIENSEAKKGETNLASE